MKTPLGILATLSLAFLASCGPSQSPSSADGWSSSPSLIDTPAPIPPNAPPPMF